MTSKGLTTAPSERGGAKASASEGRTMLGRISMILDSFDDRERLSLGDLVGITGLPRSTTHRLATSLCEAGLLTQRAGQYQLGNRLFELGARTPWQRRLREAALPFLYDLYAASGGVVHLGSLDDDEVVYVEKITGHSAPSLPSRVGGRMPAHATALGKAMLAYNEPAIADRLIHSGLRSVTPYTIVVPAVLIEGLEEVRAAGYAVDREEAASNVTCVAVPVLGPGRKAIAAVSVSKPSGELNAAATIPLLKSAAAQIGRAHRMRRAA